MTNYERWRIYCRELSSPDNYIDWGWYFMIGAALQRCVWIGSGEYKLFANKNVLLVGPAGTGKGLVIRPVNDFLRHWKLKDMITIESELKDEAQKNTLKSIRDKEHKKALESNGGINGKTAKIEPLLIPIAADTTTFEKLTNSLSTSFRYRDYVYTDEATGEKHGRIYGHSSVTHVLPELSSLMRKKAENIVNFMLGMYDCPDTYIYDTMSRGEDIIVKGCMNLLAGTTPHYIESMFDDGLVTEGFSSRTFAIFASQPRSWEFEIPPKTPEQMKHKEHMLAHIHKLTGLYGEVKKTKATSDWLKDWFTSYMTKRKDVARNRIMDDYVSRLNIHVQKLTLAIYFGEYCEMPGNDGIPLEYYQQAIDVLLKEQKNMERAWIVKVNNPIYNLGRKILEYCHDTWKEGDEIIIDLQKEGKTSEIQEALSFLIETDQILQEVETDPHIKDKKVIKYKKKI